MDLRQATLPSGVSLAYRTAGIPALPCWSCSTRSVRTAGPGRWSPRSSRRGSAWSRPTCAATAAATGPATTRSSCNATTSWRW